MSIIHDALKKVQRSLSSKNGEVPTGAPVNNQPNSGYIYDTTPAVEVISSSNDQNSPTAVPEKSTWATHAKTILAILCALAITGGSIWYLYQQYASDIPSFQRLAKKSIYKMLNKEEIPEFKTKKPEDLKPLAQISINSPGSSSISGQASSGPITLNIHGIMANPTGNLALINDEVYQEGDSVGGARIVKIDLNTITVIINGAQETIHVKN